MASEELGEGSGLPNRQTFSAAVIDRLITVRVAAAPLPSLAALTHCRPAPTVFLSNSGKPYFLKTLVRVSGSAMAAPPPWATAVTTMATSGMATPPPAALNYRGLWLIPPKLIKKIIGKVEVDIWELLPDLWQVEAEGSCFHSKRLRRNLLTDISVWTEFYATTNPRRTLQRPLISSPTKKASRTFDGPAWAS